MEFPTTFDLYSFFISFQITKIQSIEFATKLSLDLIVPQGRFCQISPLDECLGQKCLLTPL